MKTESGLWWAWENYVGSCALGQIIAVCAFVVSKFAYRFFTVSLPETLTLWRTSASLPPDRARRAYDGKVYCRTSYGLVEVIHSCRGIVSVSVYRSSWHARLYHSEVLRSCDGIVSACSHLRFLGLLLSLDCFAMHGYTSQSFIVIVTALCLWWRVMLFCCFFVFVFGTSDIKQRRIEGYDSLVPRCRFPECIHTSVRYLGMFRFFISKQQFCRLCIHANSLCHQSTFDLQSLRIFQLS